MAKENVAALRAAFKQYAKGDFSPIEALGDACLYLGRLDECRAAAEELARRAETAGDAHSYVLGRINAALARRYGGESIGPEVIADVPVRLTDPSPTMLDRVARLTRAL